MEPSTKIDAGSAEWLGFLAVICTVLAELLTLGQTPHRQRTTYVQRERMSRTIRQTARSR